MVEVTHCLLPFSSRDASLNHLVIHSGNNLGTVATELFGEVIHGAGSSSVVAHHGNWVLLNELKDKTVGDIQLTRANSRRATSPSEDYRIFIRTIAENGFDGFVCASGNGIRLSG